MTDFDRWLTDDEQWAFCPTCGADYIENCMCDWTPDLMYPYDPLPADIPDAE
jgi:hypothetical protein